jgi:hypothetical protein
MMLPPLTSWDKVSAGDVLTGTNERTVRLRGHGQLYVSSYAIAWIEYVTLYDSTRAGNAAT